jgi:hypothetical protein
VNADGVRCESIGNTIEPAPVLKEEPTHCGVDVAAREVLGIRAAIEELLYYHLTARLKAREPNISALRQRQPIGKQQIPAASAAAQVVMRPARS